MSHGSNTLLVMHPSPPPNGMIPSDYEGPSPTGDYQYPREFCGLKTLAPRLASSNITVQQQAPRQQFGGGLDQQRLSHFSPPPPVLSRGQAPNEEEEEERRVGGRDPREEKMFSADNNNNVMHNKAQSVSSDDEDDGGDDEATAQNNASTLETGRWSSEEHSRFLDGLEIYGRRKWQKIAELVGTRTTIQVRSHAQKYFKKLRKESEHANQGAHLGGPNVGRKHSKIQNYEPRKYSPPRSPDYLNASSSASSSVEFLEEGAFDATLPNAATTERATDFHKKDSDFGSKKEENQRKQLMFLLAAANGPNDTTASNVVRSCPPSPGEQRRGNFFAKNTTTNLARPSQFGQKQQPSFGSVFSADSTGRNHFFRRALIRNDSDFNDRLEQVNNPFLSSSYAPSMRAQRTTISEMPSRQTDLETPDSRRKRRTLDDLCAVASLMLEDSDEQSARAKRPSLGDRASLDTLPESFSPSKKKLPLSRCPTVEVYDEIQLPPRLEMTGYRTAPFRP